MASFERSVVVAGPAAMQLPRSARGLTVETLPVGTVLGRAWILLLGVIPVDYDRLAIVDLDPGRSSHERSTMLLTAPVLATVLHAFFGHRHRRLRRHFERSTAVGS